MRCFCVLFCDVLCYELLSLGCCALLLLILFCGIVSDVLLSECCVGVVAVDFVVVVAVEGGDCMVVSMGGFVVALGASPVQSACLSWSCLVFLSAFSSSSSTLFLSLAGCRAPPLLG